MIRRSFISTLAASASLFALGLTAPAASLAADSNLVELKTSMGVIHIELDAEKAPITVANFKKYVEKKHFDNTVFHRVINNFMIQGGGFGKNAEGEIAQKKSMAPIKNEASNGLKNLNYTVAMARTNDPNSATAQFFINVKDNAFLNKSERSAGYAVFGKVVKGKDVVDKIKAVETGVRKVKALRGDQLVEAPFRDVPVKDVVIP